jgi:hypothetical protein
VRWVLQAGRVPPVVVARQRDLLGAIMTVIRDGTAAGEFRAVDPFLGAFSLLSQSVWFHLIRGPRAPASGIPLDRPEAAAAMQGHITDVLIRAFAPEGAVR